MESPLQKAIKTMSQLPGLGPRSAQRAVLFALKNDGLCLNQLISDLISARDSVKRCSICANLDCGEICSICLDQKRESHQLCIVENVSDLWAIERSHFFKGKYHVLGGALSAIEGVNPAKLNTQTLSNRIEIEEITEIIIALSATIEGQTTTYYIADLLSGKNLKISALALGIPMGGELNYLDDGTISAAFLDRRDIRQPESIKAA
jgi:recombination protein RecR